MTASLESQSLERLSLEEDELLAMLGADLVGPQAMPLRPAELVDRARRWLAAQHGELQVQICSNNVVKQFATAKDDPLAIAVELAKLLAGLLLPVNPVTLAVLLAKKGLKSFCSAQWEVKEDECV
jgi:hypothetical protein